MALPSFVKDATGLDDGVTNSLAASLSKLRDAKRGMSTRMSGFDDILSTVDGNSLPNLPTTDDLYGSAAIADSGVRSKINELGDIIDLTGSCFDGAMNSMKSVSKNGYGLVEDSLGAFSGTANMPSEMFGIFGLYSKAQQFAASLGIDKLVADMTGKLGCLNDSSMITDIQDEVSSALSELGLDSSGLPDDDVYYYKMKSDLSVYAAANNIDTSWTDSMSDGLGVMTSKSNELSLLAKTSADAQMTSMKETIKTNITSSTTPRSFF